MQTFQPPLFSVVIPTFNRQENLVDCLACLSPYFQPNPTLKPFFQIEVIVTDDANDRQLSDLLSQHFSWCKYTAGPRNGPAANRNHGARAASGLWLVFTDDDCLPQTGWLEAFATFADQCEVMEGRTSAVGLRRRADFEAPENDSGGCLWSCNFAIQREIFLRMGGFNESFPAPAMEDMELYLRVKKAKLSCSFVPNAVVLHPWRKRRGISFVKAHARSVANFVRLHPEQASRYSFVKQCIRCFHTIRSTFHDLIYLHLINGALRRVFLEFSSHFFVWLYIRRLDLPAPSNSIVSGS